MIENLCLRCKNEFVRTIKTQKFCSKKCRLTERNKRKNRKRYQNNLIYREKQRKRNQLWRTKEQNKRKACGYTKKHREKKHKFISQLKFECKMCLTKDNLVFHHIDPITKVNEVSQMLSSKKSIILEEIEKCVVLCSECHRYYHKLNKTK